MNAQKVVVRIRQSTFSNTSIVTCYSRMSSFRYPASQRLDQGLVSERYGDSVLLPNQLLCLYAELLEFGRSHFYDKFGLVADRVFIYFD